MEFYILKINKMRNIILLVLLFLSVETTAQDWYVQGNEHDIEIKTPISNNLNFIFFSEYEINPADIPNKLSDFEQLKKLAQDSNINFVISKPEKGIVTTEIIVNTRTFSEASYKNGLLEGKKIIYHANGSICHEIEFKNGKANGVYKLYSDKGEVILETTFKDNIKNGLRKFNNPRRDKETLEGNYQNGTMVGSLIFNDGYNVYHLPNDLKKGLVKRFYRDKLVAEYSIISEDKIHGEAKLFYPETGKVRVKIPYYLGRKNGFVEFYNANGELYNKLQYKNGKKVGNHKVYMGEKELIHENFYDDNGLKTGTWLSYDKTGKISHEQTFVNDSLNGFSKTYLKGILQNSIEYKNGKRHGQSKYFNAEGFLTSEAVYVNNSLLKETSYYADGSIYYINEQNIETNTYSIKYYDNKGNLIHENKYNNKRNPIGIHKFVDKDKDSKYHIRSETHFNNEGQQIKHTYFTYPYSGSYTETNYRNNLMHGPKINFDAASNQKIIDYHYENNGKSKKVTLEEFEKLIKEEKK